MTTVLQYLVIAAVIALVLFGVALLLFGRGEQLAALPARTSPAQLPAEAITGHDVRKVRFALALRGYRMSDVDWTLERLADELDRTRERLAEVESATGPADDGDSTGPGPAAVTSADVTSADVASADDTLVLVDDVDVFPAADDDFVRVGDADLFPDTDSHASGADDNPAPDQHSPAAVADDAAPPAAADENPPAAAADENPTPWSGS